MQTRPPTASGRWRIDRGKYLHRLRHSPCAGAGVLWLKLGQCWAIYTSSTDLRRGQRTLASPGSGSIWAGDEEKPRERKTPVRHGGAFALSIRTSPCSWPIKCNPPHAPVPLAPCHHLSSRIRPLTIHWSCPSGIFNSEAWVGIFGTVAAVSGFRPGWKATAA